jgi:hypothetical protein
MIVRNHSHSAAISQRLRLRRLIFGQQAMEVRIKRTGWGKGIKVCLESCRSAEEFEFQIASDMPLPFHLAK